MATAVKVKKMADKKRLPAVSLFGAEELTGTQLPTHEEVIKHYLHVRSTLFQENEGKKEPSAKEVSKQVTTAVTVIWIRASIPTVSQQQISAKVQKCHTDYQCIMKCEQKRKDFENKLQDFRRKNKKLFDIAACKCEDFSLCSCEKTRRVPIEERSFMIDQRNSRKMFIQGIDRKATKKLQKRLARGEEEKHQLEKYTNLVRPSTSIEECVDSTDMSSLDGSEDDVATNENDFKIEKQSPTSSQLRFQLPTLARTCDRFGVSDRAGAAVASSVLQDFGLVTSEEKSKVIDKSKLRRQRKSLRENLNKIMRQSEIEALYFDGRKDNTKVNIKKTSGYYTSIVKEEHITLVAEPDSKYLGHFTPKTGNASNIAKGIIEYLDKEEVNIDDLYIIGCDGTNTNVGRKNGVIRLLEVHFNKEFHWFVCLLHANELPLRHLLHHLDGRTKGPNLLTGPIGKNLSNCEFLPVVEYQAISVSNLPLNSIDLDLSKDQKYLLEICNAISDGFCPLSLAERNPGPLNHSRWLTTANRILRLYIASDKLTEQLITVTTFILRVYDPTWFQIKRNSSYSQGPRNLWYMISNSRYLPDNLKSVIYPVIQRNAYFAHTENILAAMLSDSRQGIRKLAFTRIMVARNQTRMAAPREFIVPKLNFHAKDYTDLICFADYTRHEPPLTKRLSVTELDAIAHGVQLGPISKRYPCHTQAVERHIKLVTEASAAVCLEKERDGYIRARIEGRKVMPKFDSKVDYKIM